MGNAEFDKFIRSNTQKDLEAPDSLDWENMNIQLPKEEKKPRLFLLLFGLSFIVLSSLVLIYSNKKEENPPLFDTEANTTNSEIKVSEILNQSNTSDPGSLEDKKKKVNAKQGSLTQKETKQLNLLKQSILLDSSDNISTNKPFDFEEVSLSKVLQTLKLSSFKTQKKIKLIPSIPSITNLKLQVQKQKEISPTERSLSQTKAERNKKSSLSFSIGFNTFNSNYNASNQTLELRNAEAAALGTNYNLGFEYALKKDFFVHMGISHQRLRKTFEEIQVEESLLERITRIKYVFHNNNYDIVATNIGVGRTISFGKHWGSKIALNINPSYMVNIEGRTLDDNKSIIDLKGNMTQQRFYFSGGAELKLFYKLKGKIIFTSFGYQQSIRANNLIKNSPLKYRPEILSINLGISRTF
jgi:hypothetical protein